MQYTIIKYPDGTSYVTVPDYGVDNRITFRINTYEDLWHLNQLVDAWNYRYGKQPHIIIPNLLDAQADRRFADNQSSGLKLVCEFLANMKATFTINCPHNAEVVEALMDNAVIHGNENFILKVLEDITEKRMSQIATWSTPGRLTLMSADAGGFKPLMKLCNDIGWKGETFSASKHREFKEGKSQILQRVDKDDFGGKDILIVDDISVKGGTFKGLATMLREKNCGNLYLAVSHITVQNLGDDPITNYFDRVYTTNSKYDDYFEETRSGGTQPDNLKIMKLW